MKTKETAKISCADVRRHICDNLGFGLNSAQCREIKHHLEHCRDCNGYFTSLKKTIRLYQSYKTPIISSKARRRLLAAISSRPARNPR